MSVKSMIRWLNKLDGTNELQVFVERGSKAGDESGWEAVSVVTEQTIEQELVQQRLAAQFGIAPAKIAEIMAAIRENENAPSGSFLPGE